MGVISTRNPSRVDRAAVCTYSSIYKSSTNAGGMNCGTTAIYRKLICTGAKTTVIGVKIVVGNACNGVSAIITRDPT
jgi:hypothetical protein